jgi:hypothetical protein
MVSRLDKPVWVTVHEATGSTVVDGVLYAYRHSPDRVTAWRFPEVPRAADPTYRRGRG